jgi:predicted nucleotidyltransferase
VFDPRKIIETLNRHGVEYVTIGGFAATLYGCPEQTFDLDILYADTPANRQRLLAALAEIEAQWDEPLTEFTLQRQPVFALNTKFGDLDILSEVLGVGTYEQAKAHAQPVTIGGQRMVILDLPTLIATKEAAADPNPRKRSALDYLKALQQRSKAV